MKIAFFATLIWACNKDTVTLTPTPEQQSQSIKEDLNSLALELRKENKTFKDIEFVEQKQKSLIIERYGKDVYEQSKASSNSSSLFSRSNNEVSEGFNNFINRIDSIYNNVVVFDSMALVISNIEVEIKNSNLIQSEKQMLQTTITSNNVIFEFMMQNQDLLGIDVNSVSRAISSSWWNSWGRCAFAVSASIFVTATAVAITVSTAGVATGLGVWVASKAIATVAVIDGC
jgi:hypothetical protein